ncbi:MULTISPECIES: metallophosphoesterase [unclassified Paenibacillus]|uniref:metallophosphoesterase n=1 Tax=unclassified Paenibacillus TaxID=185978 RepID=UPI0027884287|nr:MULTISPECIES: metallophosphoesterase [unclassified Paenibacillus]MDQ0902378.1 putative MPP superfamily phosphohydrolase [Paenibacillus sp. V4I7]MDQ0919113.1 putative MPP superfamily phosphohydrolase [Paenibacillus sp. V4I5]
MTYLSILILILLFYIIFILPTQWLKVERIKYPLDLRLKILQISDMHVERLRISPSKITTIINREKPNYIFVTGDFTKYRKSLFKLEKYLRALVICNVPIYCVLGNHDYQQKNVQDLINLLRKYGLHLLTNESVHLEQFELIGIDDFDSGKSNIERSFQNVDHSKTKIVITHDPNVVLHLNIQYDYLVAGHLHGKQFNVPFFFRIKNAGKLPRMGIYKGLHKNRFGTYYISKGIGQTGINARFLVRSEITMHYL